MNLSEVILSSVTTEKSSFLKESGIYSIKVSPRSNKILVKKAVEKFFSVKVISVRIVNQKMKINRSMMSNSGRIGRKSSFKKAYVQIKKGEKISQLEV